MNAPISWDDHGDLIALNPIDLRLIWRLPGAIVEGATPHVVFTSQGHGCLSALAARDAVSGGVLWSIAWCGFGSSLAADDTLFVSYDRGPPCDTVTARELATGSVRWHVKMSD